MSAFVRLHRSEYPDNALDSFTATSQFKLDNARAMMWLSQLAFETDDEFKVGEILKAWHLTKLGFASNNPLTGLPPHSACVVIAEGHGATFVTFAGSDPGKFEDWITDFEVMPSPEGLHSGFKTAVQSVSSEIDAAMTRRTAPAQPVFFTGHSLGGALAILAAANAAGKQNAPPIVVYTFGSPRNGGEAFFGEYTPLLGNTTFRMVHGTDIVATVPPTLPVGGYRHVGQAVHCARRELFDGVAPMASNENKPNIIESAIQAALEDIRPISALQLVRDNGPGLRNALALLLPGMLRDHIPASYFRALSIIIP